MLFWSWSFLAFLTGAGGRGEIAHWWSFGTVSRRMAWLGRLVQMRNQDVFWALRVPTVLSCRLGEELLEIFQQIGGGVEEGCNLRINVLNRLLLSLVGLKDFEKLLVYLGLVLEAVLSGEKERGEKKLAQTFFTRGMQQQCESPPKEMARSTTLTLILFT